MQFLTRNSIREALRSALLVTILTAVVAILISCDGKQPTEGEEDLIPIPELQISANEIVQEVFFEMDPDSTWPMERTGEYGFQFKLPPGAIAPGGTTTFDLVGSVYGLHESSLVLWESTDGDTGVVWAMSGISSLMLQFPVYYSLSSHTDPSVFVIDGYIRGISYHVEYLKLRLIKRTSYNCQLLEHQLTGATFFARQDTSLMVARFRGIDKIVEVNHDGSIGKQWAASYSNGWIVSSFYNNDLFILAAKHDVNTLYRLGPEDVEAELIATGEGFGLSCAVAIGSSMYGLGYHEDIQKTYLYEFDIQKLLQFGLFNQAIVDSVELGSDWFYGPIGITSTGQLLLKQSVDRKENIILITTDGEIIGQWKTPFRWIVTATYDGSSLILWALDVKFDDGIDLTLGRNTNFRLPPSIWSIQASMNFR